ncbi:hypothetical protein MPTK2_8g13270 [Marchantia polymorpha subsp. ruderalis]
MTTSVVKSDDGRSLWSSISLVDGMQVLYASNRSDGDIARELAPLPYCTLSRYYTLLQLIVLLLLQLLPSSCGTRGEPRPICTPGSLCLPLLFIKCLVFGFAFDS